MKSANVVGGYLVPLRAMILLYSADSRLVEWYENDIKGGNGLNPDAEQAILDDIFASYDEEQRIGDSAKREAEKRGSQPQQIVPSSEPGPRNVGCQSPTLRSSQLQPLKAKCEKEPVNPAAQLQSELSAFHEVLGAAENDAEETNNAFIERSRQRAEQSSAVSQSNKRSRGSAPDQDVIGVSPPRKRCRREETKGLPDLAADDNVIDINPHGREHYPPILAGNSANREAGLQVSSTAFQQKQTRPLSRDGHKEGTSTLHSQKIRQGKISHVGCRAHSSD